MMHITTVREMKSMQLQSKSLNVRDNLRHLDLGRMIILKLVFKKYKKYVDWIQLA